MIERKKYKKVFSGKGFLLLFLSKLFPGLLNFILFKLYEKEMK
jgi:hypothetical protein